MADILKVALMMAFFGVESENEVLCLRETENIFMISVCRETKTRPHRNSNSYSKIGLPEIIIKVFCKG